MHKRNKSKSDPFFFDWQERVSEINTEEPLYA
jgi:hypothetical protein